MSDDVTRPSNAAREAGSPEPDAADTARGASDTARERDAARGASESDADHAGGRSGAGNRDAVGERAEENGAGARTDARSEDATDERPPAVEVRGLEKSYDDVQAVDGVSFSVARGEVVGLLGPNGAGKTTCIKCTLGLIEPTTGEVSIAGIDTSRRPKAAYDRVGAMLEGARNVYWRLTVRENLEFFAGIAGRAPGAVRERHDELLDRLALDAKADETVKALSRGMKQKVSLATTLARDVDVAFLDEPTLGLDVESSLELRREVSALAREEDTAVVVSSHDMDVIQDLCDRVIVLQNGRVIANDPVEELLDVFRTQRYRLVFTEPPGRSLRGELAAEVVEWDRGPDHTTAVVSLDDGNELPVVTGQLVDAGADLDRVDAVEPDLEDVFIELTQEETDV